jgi:hypothetical protein
MSDRGLLFLISLGAVLASLAAVAWLIVTGQAFSVDGLFLLLTSGLILLAFSLYLVFMIRRAMEELKPAPPAKPGAARKAAAQTTAEEAG